MSSQNRHSIIGGESRYWQYTPSTGFDLSQSTEPRLTLQTTTVPITIAPAKSALIIIDMQNFFLSPALGRDLQGAGHKALERLVKYAIPAARKAGVRIVWVNWGLTDDEIATMPPAITRDFGFEAIVDSDTIKKIAVDKMGEVRFQGGDQLLENGKDGAKYRGLGSECGNVTLENGKVVDAGRLLMRDTWNAGLYPSLDAMYNEGTKLTERPDVWIHKNRMSGMWGSSTLLSEFLEKEGITTLFFSGVNTDQCVGGTLTDSFSKGYDCVLLSDGCGTTSPEFAQKAWEYNAEKTFGFCMSCEQLAQGVGKSPK